MSASRTHNRIIQHNGRIDFASAVQWIGPAFFVKPERSCLCVVFLGEERPTTMQ